MTPSEDPNPPERSPLFPLLLYSSNNDDSFSIVTIIGYTNLISNGGKTRKWGVEPCILSCSQVLSSLPRL